MSSPEELAAATRAHNRAYDEETIRQQLEDQKAHRERRESQHRETVRRTDRRGDREEFREKLDVPYDDADTTMRTPKRPVDKDHERYAYVPETEDEKRLLSRLKVWQ